MIWSWCNGTIILRNFTNIFLLFLIKNQADLNIYSTTLTLKICKKFQSSKTTQRDSHVYLRRARGIPVCGCWWRLSHVDWRCAPLPSSSVVLPQDTVQTWSETQQIVKLGETYTCSQNSWVINGFFSKLVARSDGGLIRVLNKLKSQNVNDMNYDNCMFHIQNKSLNRNLRKVYLLWKHNTNEA